MRALSVAVSLAAITVPSASSSGPSECTAASAWITGCNTGTEIVIDGSRETPGDPGYTPIDNGWTPPSDDSWIPPEEEEDEFAQCLDNWDDYRLCYEALQEPDPEDPEDASPALPVVTITDVARFAPAGSAVIGEPDNVGVAGLPTNFVATASAQTVTGELFGFPVSVRFTPAAFDFSFGDGTATTTASGGASWDALGQPQFTPTETSHTYAERGTYVARADVRYTAEVDFGVGWFPIAGEVTSNGPDREVRIFEANTALVAFTCEQAPSSPGC